MKPSGWSSYDDVATTWGGVSVPAHFARPAADLLERACLAPDARMLDVGTGTGIVARGALADGPGRLIVGIDLSLGMLACAREAGVERIVAGGLPALPFRTAVFDCVLASFVLGHVSALAQALVDVCRVLEPGGVFGLTAWGTLPNVAHEAWSAVAMRFADWEDVTSQRAEALPWHGWLADPANAEQALREAGFEGVEHTHHVQHVTMELDDYLASRDISFAARILQERLPPDEWRRCRDEIEVELRERFGERVAFREDYHVIVGRKPAGD